jgi:predicted TIM-barrel fold metal-dependent hydrolase
MGQERYDRWRVSDGAARECSPTAGQSAGRLRLIDAHVHYPGGFAFPQPGAPRTPLSPDEQQRMEAALLEAERGVGAVRVCVNSAGGAPEPLHDAVQAMMRRFPDLVVGFGYIRLGVDGPEVVEALHGRGFRGLKVIRPLASYDDKAYYPVYERAEALRLPILFHTGQLSRHGTQRGQDVSTARMVPWLLDPIARAFPDLTIIGAHLGVPSFAEAAWVARWNENVYFDLSGPITIFGGDREIVHDMLYRAIKGAGCLRQIVFGSDVPAEHIPSVVAAYQALLNRLDADDAARDRVFYGTMARVLGLEA